MNLAAEDIRLIKDRLGEWLAEASLGKPPAVYEIELIKTILEQMDKRFDAVDKRFESIERRFESIDKRFEELTRRIYRFMIWSFATTLTVGGLIVATLKLWPRAEIPFRIRGECWSYPTKSSGKSGRHPRSRCRTAVSRTAF